MTQQTRDELFKKDLPLNGKLVTSEDGVLIGNNFAGLQNMRYTDARPKGIRGMTKINSTALASYPKIRSAIHFVKDQPQESHVVVQAFTGNEFNSKVYRNDTAIPNAGDFSATELHTDAASAGRGSFACAPNGALVYTNKAESLIWGGDEFNIGAFLNYDPGGEFKYDFTDALQNTLSDAENSATLHSVTSSGIDSDAKLVLHLDNDVTDSSAGAHVVTNTAVTFDNTVMKWGYSGVFDGASSNLLIADHADFDFSGATWTIDGWFRLNSLAADCCLYSQRTGANDWMRLYVDTTGAVLLKIQVGGVEGTIVGTASSTIAIDTFYHIEVSQNGTIYRIFINGSQMATATSATSPANYTQNVYLGAHHNNVALVDYFNGSMDEIRVSKVCRHTTSFEVPATPYAATVAGATAVYAYVGSTRPLTAIKPYVKTANAAAAPTISVDYWNGSTWASCTSLVDGTSGMAATGVITFADTSTVAKQSVRDSLVLYWYRLTLSASTNTVLYHMTVRDVMQPIVDVWDGIERKIASFQLDKTGSYVDYTSSVYDDSFSSADASTYANIGGMTSSNSFCVGFSERASAAHFFLGAGKVNTTACVAQVAYWNGTGWSSTGTVVDGTAADGVPLANTGIISWNPPSPELEFRRSLNQQNDVQLYYYKFTFTDTLAADVWVYYATGIPAPTHIHPYGFVLSAMNRVFLCSDQSGHKNSIRYSSDGTCDVYNGDDSGEIFFGDDRELTAGCWLYSQYGTTLYNTIALTKRDSTHILVGNGPKDWAKYCVSPTIGCPAPNTMIPISAPLEIYGGSNRTIAIWRAAKGIYMFDGKGFTPIHGDIEDLWRPDGAIQINQDVIEKEAAWYDEDNQEYHWLFASGNSENLNREYVYDVRRKRWYVVERGTGKRLRCGLRVQDTAGNSYTYGFEDGGYMQRLDYGNTFDGNSIAHVMELGDVPLDDTWRTTAIRAVELVAKAKSSTGATVTMTHAGDTATTTQTGTVATTKSGFRVSFPVKSESAHFLPDSVFHRFSFSVTTTDETVGFEPLYLSIKFHKRHDQRGT